MEVSYLKMHGTGNVILLVDQRADNLNPPNVNKLRELGNDTTGPGFDQLLWIGTASDGAARASYRVFNADGSEVQQCGNGVRCVAKFLAGDKAQEFALQSPAGPVDARVHDDGEVSVSMGAPRFEPQDIPFDAANAAGRYSIAVGGEEFDIAAVSMGNPHCVLQVGNVDEAPVKTLGPQLECHQRFPEHANVGFVQVIDRSTVHLRVFERGVGETRACGTGACAAVVCGQNLGQLDTVVTVHLPGGQVMVSWRGGDEPVWLTGDAEYISEGTIDL